MRARIALVRPFTLPRTCAHISAAMAHSPTASSLSGISYVCMYVCIYYIICMYVCMYVYIYPIMTKQWGCARSIHIHALCVYACVCVCVCACKIHTHTHTHTHHFVMTWSHTHTHIHNTHTYTLSEKQGTSPSSAPQQHLPPDIRLGHGGGGEEEDACLGFALGHLEGGFFLLFSGRG